MIEGQYDVRSVLGGQGNVHGISEVELQIEILPPDCLCDVQNVSSHLGKDKPAGPCPPSNVIDASTRGVAAEDTTGDVVKLAQQ